MLFENQEMGNLAFLSAPFCLGTMEPVELHPCIKKTKAGSESEK